MTVHDDKFRRQFSGKDKLQRNANPLPSLVGLVESHHCEGLHEGDQHQQVDRERAHGRSHRPTQPRDQTTEAQGTPVLTALTALTACVCVCVCVQVEIEDWRVKNGIEIQIEIESDIEIQIGIGIGIEIESWRLNLKSKSKSK